MLNQASAILNSVRLSYSTKYNNLIFLAKKILLFCWCCKISWIYALASHHETIYIPQFFFCLHTLKGINVDGWCCQFLNEASYAGSIFPTFRNFHVRRNKGLILTDRQKFLLEKSRVNWMLPSFQKLCRSSLPIFFSVKRWIFFAIQFLLFFNFANHSGNIPFSIKSSICLIFYNSAAFMPKLKTNKMQYHMFVVSVELFLSIE